MKVPLFWIKEFVETNLSPAQIAHTYTQAGVEIDNLETYQPAFKGVVVAKILETYPHPNAEKLTMAKVTDGTETFQIVCGAPNCRPGIKTALAKIGAELPLPDGTTFKIKKSKIRGEESQGMLCAGDELGLSSDHDGILEFTDHMKEGENLADLYSDVILDVSLTPNLGHAASVLGLARELSTFLKIPVKQKLRPQIIETAPPIYEKIKIIVEDKKSCPQYMARMIQGVKIGASPEWLKKRLLTSGIRSVNNVVDVTNFILREIGQPLHVFDLDKIDGDTLFVRHAFEGEILETLDGKTRDLRPESLVIADASKVLAIAGLMGGLNSEVTESTVNILIECSYFASSAVRKTSKKMQMTSDSSKKFERGIDPMQLSLALDRAAAMIQDLAGGEIRQGVINIISEPFSDRVISCRLSRINKILGSHFSVDEIEHFFNHLDFKSKFDGQDTFEVIIPAYRNDITLEADLIGEAARVAGFENFNRDPAVYQATQMPLANAFIFEREVKRKLIQEGLQEFVNCDLIGPTLLKKAYGTEEISKETAKVLHPVSIEQSVLRTSLLPGLLETVKTNYDRECQDIAGFEVGRVHFKDGENYSDNSLLAIVLSGKSSPNTYAPKASHYDFRDLKAIVEDFLKKLGIENYVLKRSSLETLHPGRQASVFIGDVEVGSFGEIHPAVQRRLDVPQRILFGEFALLELYRNKPKALMMKPFSLFPASERDWTITLTETAPIEDVLKIIRSFSSSLLESVQLIDIYRSASLGADKKNATFRFVYRDQEKTLDHETTDKEHARIINGTTELISRFIPSP